MDSMSWVWSMPLMRAIFYSSSLPTHRLFLVLCDLFFLPSRKHNLSYAPTELKAKCLLQVQITQICSTLFPSLGKHSPTGHIPTQSLSPFLALAGTPLCFYLSTGLLCFLHHTQQSDCIFQTSVACFLLPLIPSSNLPCTTLYFPVIHFSNERLSVFLWTPRNYLQSALIALLWTCLCCKRTLGSNSVADGWVAQPSSWKIPLHHFPVIYCTCY